MTRLQWSFEYRVGEVVIVPDGNVPGTRAEASDGGERALGELIARRLQTPPRQALVDGLPDHCRYGHVALRGFAAQRLYLRPRELDLHPYHGHLTAPLMASSPL